MLKSVAVAALALAAGANAHFTVQYPNVVGPLKEDQEGSGPCGGYSVNLNNMQTMDFHVDGDAIAATSTHPTTSWLFRMTTDPTASGNWTQIYGIVQQTGVGEFCAKQVTIPSEFVGQKAVIGIVADGEDGMLFQCAAVNFVNGTTDTPSSCVNGTKISATYTQNKDLSNLLGDGSSDSTPSPTSTPNAAPSLQTFATGGLGALVSAGAMVMAGFAFMI